MKTFSKIISYILHPVFMPTIGVALIFYSGIYLSFISANSKYIILLTVFLITTLMPSLLLLLMFLQKKITKITISDRQERLIPILVSLIFYYFAYYILKKYHSPFFIQQFMFVSFLCLLLTFVIHLKWKISMHMVGIGGILGLWSAMSALFYLLEHYWILPVLILVAGTIGSVRLFLKEHNQKQIYSGFLLGYIISFSILLALNLK